MTAWQCFPFITRLDSMPPRKITQSIQTPITGKPGFSMVPYWNNKPNHSNGIDTNHCGIFFSISIESSSSSTITWSFVLVHSVGLSGKVCYPKEKGGTLEAALSPTRLFLLPELWLMLFDFPPSIGTLEQRMIIMYEHSCVRHLKTWFRSSFISQLLQGSLVAYTINGLYIGRHEHGLIGWKPQKEARIDLAYRLSCDFVWHFVLGHLIYPSASRTGGFRHGCWLRWLSFRWRDNTEKGASSLENHPDRMNFQKYMAGGYKGEELDSLV